MDDMRKHISNAQSWANINTMSWHMCSLPEATAQCIAVLPFAPHASSYSAGGVRLRIRSFKYYTVRY